MLKQKQFPFNQFQAPTALNIHGSVYYSTYLQSSPKKALVLKRYVLSPTLSLPQQFQRLKRLYSCNHPLIIKPIGYTIDMTKQNMIYLCMEVERFSLEALMQVHRMQGKQVGFQVIKAFAKLFDTINRVYKNGLQHGNLKPTNVFLQIPDKQINSIEEIQFKLSQACLLTNSKNKYYKKPQLIDLRTSKSSFVDPFQNDCYSIGIMLLELASLDPIEKIYNLVSEGKLGETYFGENKRKIPNEHFENVNLCNLIKLLLNPKDISSNNSSMNSKTSSLSQAYHLFCDQSSSSSATNRQSPIHLQIEYSKYFNTSQCLLQFLTQSIPLTITKQLHQSILKHQEKSYEILHYLGKEIDPEEDFFFYSAIELIKFMEHYQVPYQKITKPIFIWYFFYLANDEGQMNYMRLLVDVTDKKDLAKTIIQKCLDKYQSIKQFYQDQSRAKDYWNTNQIYSFFQMLRVPFTQQDIKNIVCQMTQNPKASSIKIQQFRKIFKGLQNPSQSILKSSKKLIDNNSRQKLIQLLQQLQKVKPNLLNFFRIHDLKGKWSIPFVNIKEEIKKYIKGRRKQQQKQIFDQMFQLAKINQKSKDIDYVVLIKKCKLYDNLQLFRMILSLKINQQGKQAFFQKYLKDPKGWSLNSMIDFCQQQYLQFDQREVRSFFSTIDKDSSGYISLKELLFKLTGIQQFDIQHVVQIIKDKLNKKGKLFDMFLKVDQDARLMLDGLRDLQMVLDLIGVRLEQQHVSMLYQKFQRKGKFQYMAFLRYFITLEEIFLKASEVIIQQHYKGNFDHFYKLGLKGDKKKWSRQSLTLVNQNLILGFRQNQLNQLWKILDKNNQISLTKQQIGQLFNKKVQRLQQFKGRSVENINDLRPNISDKLRSNHSIKDNDSFEQNKRQKTKSDRDNIQDNQLIRQLKKIRLSKVVQKCYKLSIKNSVCQIQVQQFCQVLLDFKIQTSSKFLQQTFKSFIKRASKSSNLNYLKLIFLTTHQLSLQQSCEQKSQIIIYLLNKILQKQRLSTQELFEQNCRKKDRMKLNDFQKIVRKFIDLDMFFDDINQVWECWGTPQYITKQDWNLIIQQNNNSNRKVKKNMTFGTDIHKDKTSQSDYYTKNRQKQNSRQRQPKRESNKQKSQQQQRQNDYDRNRNHKQKQSIRDNYNNQDSRNRQRQPKTPYLRSRQESVQNRRRKQSNDSVQLSKFARLQKQRQETGKFNRQSNSRDTNYNQRNQRNDRNNKNEQDNRNQRNDRNERNDRNQRNDRNERNDINNRNQRNQRPQRLQIPKQKSQLSRQTLMQNQLIVNSITQLFQQFQQSLQQNTSQQIQNLFGSANKVDTEDFIRCLVKYYRFSKRDAQHLAREIDSFGKVKVEVVKKYITQAKNKTKNKTNYKSSKDKQDNLDQRDRANNFKFATKQKNKDNDYNQNKKMAQTSANKPVVPQKRLKNPNKQKLNAPLIKQHIKLLINGFSQRFAIQQLERYFFQQSDSLSLQQFNKKCLSITSSVSPSMIQKIFQYLHPSIQSDQISLLSFKMAFSTQQLPLIEQTYLPAQLQKQLKQIFNQHDKDKSGGIQTTEIQMLLTSLGINQTRKQIEQIFKRIDTNYDGQVSFEEFKTYIQQEILPILGNFQDDVDQLLNMMNMNDIFNTGCLQMNVLSAILQRFGVKVTNQQLIALVRTLGTQTQQIPIYPLIHAIFHPSSPQFPPIMRSCLYKIKLRKRLSLKQIQKTFQSISSSFIMSYTSRLIKTQQLKRSCGFQPELHQTYLFYMDYFYKDLRGVKQGKNQKLLIDQDVKGNTLMVEVKFMEAQGVPIPQNNNIKTNILKRSLNVTFFDMSSEQAKHSITTIIADFDPQVEDQWLFNKNNRSIFVKIANYQPKKYQKILLLFQLVITILDNGKSIDISCGSANIPIKQIASVDNKLQKKLKLIAGIPNKSKQIDKVSVSKRSGWKTFIGNSSIDSQLQLQINHASKFKQKHPMIYTLPSCIIVCRKSLHYLFTFREYFAQESLDVTHPNPQFLSNHTVRSFLLSLQIQDLSPLIMTFWNQKIEPLVETIDQARKVMMIWLTEFGIILGTKQFQLRLANTAMTVIHNKSLFNLRIKMLQQVFDNVQNYVKNDLKKGSKYKRIKQYNYNYLPIKKALMGRSLHQFINQNGSKTTKV